MRKRRLLIVGPETTVTIVRNADMLKNDFRVKLVRFRNRSTIDQVVDIWKVFTGALWSDVTLSHFATMHAFWAVFFCKILRKKSIVIVAGYEVAKVPEIEYGVMLKPRKAWLVKQILEHADRILAVSEFTRSETMKFVGSKDIRVVYGCNAIDCDYFKPDGEKDDVVLTVGIVHKSNIRRKGFETFIKAAEYIPQTKFVLLGRQDDDSAEYLKSIAPQNVVFGDDKDLLRWYQKARVYCQLSYYESFGVCLIEAMSCECIPVVVDRGALPEVAGDVGFYAPYGDAKATAEVIGKALRSDKARAARERVKMMFSVEVNRGEFANEIRETIDLRKNGTIPSKKSDLLVHLRER